MKRIVLLTTVFIASAGSAYAADLIVDEPVMEAALAASDWSGGYIGLQVGYTSGAFDDTFPPSPPAETDGDLAGPFIGLYGGANVQFDSIVLGFDADLNYAAIEGAAQNIFATEEMRVNLDWTGALRGRVGVAADSLLFYAAGGVAVANTHLEIEVVGAPPPFTVADDLLVGWTVGVGAEAILADNWVGRAEYRYSDYGTIDYTTMPGDGTAAITTHAVAVGVAYKF